MTAGWRHCGSPLSPVSLLCSSLKPQDAQKPPTVGVPTSGSYGVHVARGLFFVFSKGDLSAEKKRFGMVMSKALVV